MNRRGKAQEDADRRFGTGKLGQAKFRRTEVLDRGHADRRSRGCREQDNV